MRSKRKMASGRGGIPWTPAERWVQRGVIGLVALVALLAGWLAISEDSERTVVAAGSDIRLPLRDLKPSKLRLVTYMIGPSASISVAIERGKDKVLRVAFGSCRSCRRFSHYTSFGKLVCGRCQHVMKLPDPGSVTEEKKSGCALSSLPYSIEGDVLVVRGETVAAEYSRQFAPATQRGSNR